MSVHLNLFDFVCLLVTILGDTNFFGQNTDTNDRSCSLTEYLTLGLFILLGLPKPSSMSSSDRTGDKGGVAIRSFSCCTFQELNSFSVLISRLIIAGASYPSSEVSGSNVPSVVHLDLVLKYFDLLVIIFFKINIQVIYFKLSSLIRHPVSLALRGTSRTCPVAQFCNLKIPSKSSDPFHSTPPRKTIVQWM